MKAPLAWLLVLVACNGDPLVGKWDGPATTSLGSTYHAEVDLQGGGSLTYSLIGAGSCNGTLFYSGYTWSADATTITFAGTPTCTGTISCGALSVDCSKAQQSSTLGACGYVLSADQKTLTTSNCSNGSLSTTWTRAD